jgi:putative spermidine/putrescine transport system ATP-binding protein
MRVGPNSPRILLMNEPLGALDKKLRDSLQLEIKSIHAELGTTFVGRIEQIGTPTELYERPDSLFVAQFLGESSLTASRGEQPNGTPVAVVVRPERIRIEPDGPRPGSNNAVPGRISQHIYFGNSRKVEVCLDDGTTDRVWLTFDPNDAAILATGKLQVATPPEPTTAGSR